MERDHVSAAQLNSWENITQARDYHVLVKVLQPGSVAHKARTVVRQVLWDAGIGGEDVSDAESAVAELAANAESHAHGPYELRIITVDGIPAWCEVVDGDQNLNGIPEILCEAEADDPSAFWFRESGRGLLLVRHLSGGRCTAYRTTTCATGVPGKAVAFSFPRQGVHMSLDRQVRQPAGEAISTTGRSFRSESDGASIS